MGSNSNEKMISLLYQIIDSELAKPNKETDIDLIAECSDLVDELSNDTHYYTDEELDAKLKELHRRAEKPNNQPKQVIKAASCTHKEIKRKIKWIGIAVAVMIATSVITISAASGQLSKAWQYVSDNIQKILGLAPGDSLQEGEIKVIKGNGTATYPSIEDYLRQENPDILYPSALPDKIYINKIVINQESDAMYTLLYQTTSNNLSISVSNYLQNDLSSPENYIVYDTPYITFYIKEMSNRTFQAIGQRNGFEYYINFSDYEQLITILDNMKGMSK